MRLAVDITNGVINFDNASTVIFMSDDNIISTAESFLENVSTGIISRSVSSRIIETQTINLTYLPS